MLYDQFVIKANYQVDYSQEEQSFNEMYNPRRKFNVQGPYVYHFLNLNYMFLL